MASETTATALSVNVNKIAVLRNSRGGLEPDVLRAARTCLAAGAQGITVHPRPDRRHITAEDVVALAGLTAQHQVELNVEGNPFAPPRAGYPGLLDLCGQIRPAQVTLVPDSDGQLTSDHGFDFTQDTTQLASLVGRFKALGCRVSLFVAWIMGWYAARVGSNARDESQMIDPVELRRLREIAEARKAGLQPPAEPPHNS